MAEKHHTIIQEVISPELTQKQISFYIKREDLIHPEISGNKWYKLKYNLIEASKSRKTVLTFGGAYSNHILAVAAGAKLYGVKAFGLIRGEPEASNNPTLSQAQELGMGLKYVSRTAYKDKETLLEMVREEIGDFYYIPEGGTNCLAIKGCKEILKDLAGHFDFMACACGTGGTLAGMVSEATNIDQAIGFSVLKGGFMKDEVVKHLDECGESTELKWSINDDYHFGGYAKYDQNLIDFINHFYQEHGIPLDPIYTGKLVFGLWDLLRKDFFKPGTRILAIHSGGLQGIRGFNHRFGGILKIPSN